MHYIFIRFPRWLAKFIDYVLPFFFFGGEVEFISLFPGHLHGIILLLAGCVVVLIVIGPMAFS
jgi:hypothetical protein